MEIWEVGQSVSTRSKKETSTRFSYRWTIQNFNKYNNSYEYRTGNEIMSPLFRSSNSEYRLMIYPNGLGDPDIVSIALDPQIECEFSAESDVEFFILDNEMGQRNQKSTVRFFNRYFMCKNFVEKNILYDTDKKLLNNNDLTVVCTFTKRESALENNKSEFEQCREKVSLSNDLHNLLQNKSLTDIVLIVNDKKLYAHKCILSARSSVFSAMLQNDMEEKLKSEIHIQDFNADVLTEMLQFMYTDKVSNIKEHFQDLLCLANKYDIEGLKLLCEEFMLSELTVDNVIEVFFLAQTQNCSVLRPKILKFIMKNTTMIMQSSKFESQKNDLPFWLIDILKTAKQ